jgi:hypothetical protein
MLGKMAPGPDRAAAKAFTRRAWTLLVAGFLATVFAYACVAGTSGDCAENGTCAPLADDGATETSPALDGSTKVDAIALADSVTERDADAEGSADGSSFDEFADGDGGESNACDSSKTPHQDPCVISSLYGVFVSPGGDDGQPGTPAQPVKTFHHAIDVASKKGLRVYVCAGSFAEHVLLTATLGDGLSFYGGIDCPSATYGPQNKAVVAPTTGLALDLEGLVVGASFEDIEFDGPDADPNSSGGSSIAAFVQTSTNVTLNRVTLSAGNAADGAGGVSGGSTGDPSNLLPATMLTGGAALDASGAASQNCVCPDGTTSSTGGQGSASTGFLDGGHPPGAGLPSYGGDAGAGDPGTDGLSCGMGGTAQNGADAPPAASRAPGTSWGTLSLAGWAPTSGTPGSNGLPGQGGGGGGNGTLGTGAGGGGACGGCGGAGGKQGLGGGSSIALLSFKSGVALAECILTAHNAGSGGAGGNGESGQAGGSAGMPFGLGATAGCAGGAGGTGSGGNGGQGGAGGLSLGIGYSGTPPTFDGVAIEAGATSSSITTGTAGAGGFKGAAGPAPAPMLGLSGADGANGPAGVAEDVLEL